MDHDDDKYITNQEFNKLTQETLTARLAQENLASEDDITNFVKKIDFDNKLKNLDKISGLSEKVKAISTKGLRKDLTNKSIIFNGAKYFSLGIFQNHLVFIPAKKYIKYFSATTQTNLWKSNGMSDKKY